MRKKILGAVQDLPGKQHSQSSPICLEIGWIGCAIQQANPKRLPGSFFLVNTIFFIYLFQYETIENYTRAFFMVIIVSIGSAFSHSIYIRTVSSQHLIPALLNWFKQVYGPIGQSNSISTQTSQEGIECTKPKEQLRVYCPDIH